MTERDQPSVESILAQGRKIAPRGLPSIVENRIALLNWAYGASPLREEYWFIDGRGVGRRLKADEEANIRLMMSLLTPSQGSFYQHITEFFNINNAQQFPVRLDIPQKFGSGIIGDSIPDTTVNVEEEILYQEKMGILRKVIAKLSEKERRLIELYYEKGMTCEQIGQDPMFNVSKSRVQQLRKAVHKKLRSLLSYSNF